MDHNYSQPHTNIAHTDTHKRTAHPLSNVELPHALFQRYQPMAVVLLKYGRPFSSRFNFAIYTFNCCCCCCCCVGFYFHFFVCAHIHASCKIYSTNTLAAREHLVNDSRSPNCPSYVYTWYKWVCDKAGERWTKKTVVLSGWKKGIKFSFGRCFNARALLTLTYHTCFFAHLLSPLFLSLSLAHSRRGFRIHNSTHSSERKTHYK